MARIAINGFGRIGRAAFKVALRHSDIEVVAINDLTDSYTLAHLLSYDTNYGITDADISSDEHHVIVNGKKYPILAEKDPLQLPWKEYEVDIVLECTGRFRTAAKAEAHVSAGAKRVIISAPADDAVPTVVCGVNADSERGKEKIVSNASCTTNSLAPVMDVLSREFGCVKAVMSTVHSYTADQTLVDGPHKDLRRARGAAMNIIPTTTGAAIATTRVLPELEDKFDGISLRVPTSVVSVSDITVVLNKKTTPEDINNAFVTASKQDRYKGVITVSDKELVSSDFKGNPASAIVDLPMTKVVDGDLAKIIVWYDNEWGYANRLVELAIHISG